MHEIYDNQNMNQPADAMNNLGALYQKAGSNGEAESWYRRAAQAGNATAMTNLASLLSKIGRNGEAHQ